MAATRAWPINRLLAGRRLFLLPDLFPARQRDLASTRLFVIHLHFAFGWVSFPGPLVKTFGRFGHMIADGVNIIGHNGFTVGKPMFAGNDTLANRASQLFWMFTFPTVVLHWKTAFVIASNRSRQITGVLSEGYIFAEKLHNASVLIAWVIHFTLAVCLDCVLFIYRGVASFVAEMAAFASLVCARL